jgi:predicted nucleotidyltransferase
MTVAIDNNPADMIMFDPDIIESICRENGILRLYLVGSATRSDHTSLSDLDFLVTFEAMERPLEQYFAAKYAFEQAFNRKVDLIMENAVKNPRIRAGLDADKQLLYEA